MADAKTITRFIGVGLTAATTEYSLFILLYVWIALPLLVANSLSFLAGFAVSFSLNRLWAFRRGDYRYRMRAQLGFYAALAAINLVLSNLIVGLIRTLGFSGLIGKFTAMIMIACWNYLLMKQFIFSEKST